MIEEVYYFIFCSCQSILSIDVARITPNAVVLPVNAITLLIFIEI